MLRCTLQSLACGKKKVLKKRPVGKEVNDEDVFVFNNAFDDPRAKVHINSIQVKETVSGMTLYFPLLFFSILKNNAALQPGSESSSFIVVTVCSPRNRNTRRAQSRATGSITSTRRLCAS
jgi:hypothetical protein